MIWKRRFSDLLQMTVPHWSVVSSLLIHLQSILTYKKASLIIKVTEQLYQKPWMNGVVSKIYPLLWKNVAFTSFSHVSFHLVWFHSVVCPLSKARNRLDAERRGNLRNSLTALKLSTDKLLAKHQSQGTH